MRDVGSGVFWYLHKVKRIACNTWPCRWFLHRAGIILCLWRLWALIHLFQLLWKPWAHTPSATGSDVPFPEQGCYVSTVLPVTLEASSTEMGTGKLTPPRCLEHLRLQEKTNIFLKHKRSPCLETTTTTDCQRGLVHFLK